MDVVKKKKRRCREKELGEERGLVPTKKNVPPRARDTTNSKVLSKTVTSTDLNSFLLCEAGDDVCDVVEKVKEW